MACRKLSCRSLFLRYFFTSFLWIFKTIFEIISLKKISKCWNFIFNFRITSQGLFWRTLIIEIVAYVLVISRFCLWLKYKNYLNLYQFILPSWWAIFLKVYYCALSEVFLHIKLLLLDDLLNILKSLIKGNKNKQENGKWWRLVQYISSIIQ